MANPRLTVDFEGIGLVTATYSVDGSIVPNTATGGAPQVGAAVRITGNKTVGITVDATHVLGKLLTVETDGRATVQSGGYGALPGGTAATLTPGTKICGALFGGVGGAIRSIAAATLAEVAVARGLIVDSADSTQVMVLLD